MTNICVTLCLFAILLINVNSKPNDQHLISKTNYTVAKQNEIFVQNLEIIKLKVRDTKRNVESIIQQLEHIREETEEDTFPIVMQRWWDQINSYKNYVNLLLASMRREVNAVRAKGKDAQHCYDANFCAISQHSDTAYKVAEKCEKSAESAIKNSLVFIDNFISFGETLITELNDLLINCHDNDNIKMQSCIHIELETININVKSFRENTKSIKLNGLSTSNYVVLQASKCLDNVYLLARFESKGAMSSNSRCIQDVVENKKTDDVIKKLVHTCKLRVTSI
ncbi:uncharacterized protein [Anoplolepis gracilipes]|uniref:uncharacterized protein n=1 Tax=Anoplolepis gracilipes TaxID=354296 RepID=UPI003BA1AAFC